MPGWHARPTLGRKGVSALATAGLLSVMILRAPVSNASRLVCNGKWHLQTASDLHDDEFLNAVSAMSIGDAWAVGDFADGIGALKPLFDHWDGVRWSEVPGAALPDGLLRGVAGISHGDVWAVGGRNERLPARTLTEHWDGSTWSVVPSPTPGLRFTGSGLEAVDATSSDDVWAVGSRGVQDGDRTLVEHWNGSSWTVVPSANAPGMDTNILTAVSSLSPEDIWAVGYAFSNADFVPHTLTEHWDGTSWTVIPSPDATIFGDLLYGVSASSGADVWVDGEDVDLSGDPHALTEHWDGTSWSIVPGADQGIGGLLNGVSATSSGRAWAVGGFTTQSEVSLVLADLWSGSEWTLTRGVSPGTFGNFLDGVDALSDKSVFAVGYYNNADYYAHSLTEYFC